MVAKPISLQNVPVRVPVVPLPISFILAVTRVRSGAGNNQHFLMMSLWMERVYERAHELFCTLMSDCKTPLLSVTPKKCSNG